jgi:hypothetical protein
LYGEEYVVDGAMYRGEPPKQFFNPAFVVESKRMNEHFMLPLQGHPFNEFVGVQGASSTNPTTNPASNLEKVVADTPLAVEWTNPFGKTADGIPGFVARSFGAKRIESNYVFGSGPCGVGYYHVTTKESYQILSNRIAARIQKLQSDIAMTYSCSFCAPSSSYAVTQKKEQELRELREYLAVVKARVNATRPVGEVKVPVNSYISRASAKKPYHRQDFYGHNDMWRFPQELYNCTGGYEASGGSGNGTQTSSLFRVMVCQPSMCPHCF